MNPETRSRVVYLGVLTAVASGLVAGPARAAPSVPSPASAPSPSTLIVGASPRCRVQLTQVSYDDPGADDAEFLELHVEVAAGWAPNAPPAPSPPLPSCGPPPADAGASDSSDGGDAGAGALTLGACGLATVELVNGGGGACETYRSLPVANIVVPPDGYVVFCATDATLGASCDVTAAGRSALRNGWLQNGPTDGLRFVGTAGETTLEVAYEGAPACFGPGAVPLLGETGALPGASPETDDVNVACGRAFRFFPPADSPLRAPAPCPTGVTDGGRTDGGGPLPGTGGSAAVPERAPTPSSYYGGSPRDAGFSALPEAHGVAPRPPGCDVGVGAPPSALLGAPWAIFAALRVARRRRRR
ncbi:MAG TPA: hypothetical protein VHE30_17940 [Polyangiaceae bacterium]|nr:hypothetical protein [Polyangiaceae bacterium]